MTLLALERLMHEVVREARPVDAAAASLGVDPARLSIYRDFVRHHVRTALDTNLGVTRALLGPDRWGALFEDYLRACPPSSWELNAAAEAFPDFLARQVDEGRPGLHPFHASVAEFEWTQFTVLRHPAVIPPAPAAPTLNPTLTLLEQGWPVVPFLVAWDRGERGAPLPEARASLALLFRHPRTERCCYFAAHDDLLFAIKATHDELDAEAAAAASGHALEAVRGALDRAHELGLVIRP